MSSLVPQEISMVVSSDPSQGAINRSQDGSEFEISLEEPLEIPRDALTVVVRVEEATVWWTVPNIIKGVNDTMYVYGDSKDNIPQLFTVQIQQGLYDLTGLNSSLHSELEKLGAKTEDDGEILPLVSFSADSSTQRVLLRLNYTNVYVDFTKTDTPREILGFNSQIVGPDSGAPLNILADQTAKFNTVNYFLLASNLVSRGMRFNNRFNQVISQILIDVPPGSQIVSKPFNPANINAQELAGSKLGNLKFRLTDDKMRPVNTNDEYYSARIVISYKIPYGLQK